MNNLYNYIERIRKQTTADELNVRSSEEGLTFIFGWTTTERQMWWVQRHYSWGELDHAPQDLIYYDLIAHALAEWERHQNAVAQDAYKRAMKIV